MATLDSAVYPSLNYKQGSKKHKDWIALREMATVTEGEIKELLEKNIEECTAEVSDFSDGCGAKFEVRVESPAFEASPPTLCPRKK